ncbi:hypothetical protein BWD42_06900 [Sphingobacterium sp. CZ-UAM]|uniref:relaxase/mobilization nuclease domain-containing protein n=1 Tax=Sphingobacterium sp. CZ-UAM TaxID=1933868 RepID=UPI0009874A0F|nr:relaxase/mobilization nuclease domain-containing protein [Sphingobacterium sp. CZ-UAM]OOG19633.1 hypothetical protein BWD42_06900 [Sphingobacterium sp. CZ-UAM]
MIVKILKKSSTFKAVNYNTGKVDKNKGELLLVKNFGVLQGIENLRPQDYINYLEAVSSSSTRIKYPQLHVAISTKGRQNSKEELSDIAQKWMDGMGYGDQPYLLIFHKDTDNNHIHLVSTRVGKDGKKISDRFEKLRAYRVIDQIMGKDKKQTVEDQLQKALSYNFSTRAQFMMLLETKGYSLNLTDEAYAISKNGIEFGSIELAKIDFRIDERKKDAARVAQIQAIFEKYRSIYDTKITGTNQGYNSDFAEFLHKKFGLEIIFHGKNEKLPYGYTLIDHAKRTVYKGGEIMVLKDIIDVLANPIDEQEKELLHVVSQTELGDNQTGLEKEAIVETQAKNLLNEFNGIKPIELPLDRYVPSELEIILPILDINISDDIDDEAILGKNRRRKRKSRANTR